MDFIRGLAVGRAYYPKNGDSGVRLVSAARSLVIVVAVVGTSLRRTPSSPSGRRASALHPRRPRPSIEPWLRGAGGPTGSPGESRPPGGRPALLAGRLSCLFTPRRLRRYYPHATPDRAPAIGPPHRRRATSYATTLARTNNNIYVTIICI